VKDSRSRTFDVSPYFHVSNLCKLAQKQGLHEWRARCCEDLVDALGCATDHLLSELAASIKLLGEPESCPH